MSTIRQLPKAAAERARGRGLILATAAVTVLALAGCQHGGPKAGGPFDGISETTQHGYVVSPDALQQVPVGSSRDQVIIALGSPSTTQTFGNEVFYYISQTRHRSAQFMPDKVVDQHVVAIYFDDKNKVARIANYGMKDGKVFDFVTQTTPTGGLDRSFVQQVFAGLIGFGPSTFGQ
jgi:outer membrane protein assembly factor BamE (lipoprotein component of BamABCDE complex)